MLFKIIDEIYILINNVLKLFQHFILIIVIIIIIIINY